MSAQLDLALFYQMQQEDPKDLAEISNSARLLRTLQMLNGSGVSQINQVHSNISAVIAASGTYTIDCGVLGNNLRDTVSFTTVKLISILLRNIGSSEATSVSFGPHTTNGFADPFSGTNPLVEIGSGGLLVMSAPENGWDITGGNDTLRVVNNDGVNTAGVEVLIAGIGS